MGKEKYKEGEENGQRTMETEGELWRNAELGRRGEQRRAHVNRWMEKEYREGKSRKLTNGACSKVRGKIEEIPRS